MEKTSDQSMINATIDFEVEGIQHGVLRVPHSVNRSAYGAIHIPIACFKNGEGPTVLLTGGIHGDEYEGPIALAKLARKLRLEDITGRILIVPSLNHPAYLAGTRVSPIDGVNLNRTFPGKRNGTITEMIAHYVTTVLLAKADFLFDFHAGGSSLNYLPSVLAPMPGQGTRPELANRLLAAFAPERVVRYDIEKAISGEDRVIANYAQKQGVLVLLGEFGGASTVNRAGLRTVEDGLLPYLAACGVWAGQADKESTSRRHETAFFTTDDAGLYAFADRPGIFEPAFSLGDYVEAGAPAGHIYDPHNPWQPPARIDFAAGGLAVCIRTYAQVEPGDCLGHLARAL